MLSLTLDEENTQTSKPSTLMDDNSPSISTDTTFEGTITHYEPESGHKKLNYHIKRQSSEKRLFKGAEKRTISVLDLNLRHAKSSFVQNSDNFPFLLDSQLPRVRTKTLDYCRSQELMGDSAMAASVNKRISFLVSALKAPVPMPDLEFKVQRLCQKTYPLLLECIQAESLSSSDFTKFLVQKLDELNEELAKRHGLGDKFHTLYRIGEGGEANVWRIRDQKTGKFYA